MKGFGVVAKKNLRAGTLLCVSKAIHVVFSEEANDGYNVDFSKWTTTDNHHIQLTQILYQRCLKDPELQKQLSKMFFGVSSNSFKTIEERMTLWENNSREMIERVVDMNSFKFQRQSSCGIWEFPSYFNHNCIPNCLYQIFGDIMVIRSCLDVEKGQELTIGYINPSNFDRTQVMQKYGIDCKCKICLDTGDMKLRNEIISNVKNIDHSLTLGKMDKNLAVKKLKEMVSLLNSHPLDQLYPRFVICVCLFQLMKLDESLKEAFQILDVLKTYGIVSNMRVRIEYFIWKAYQHMGQFDKVITSHEQMLASMKILFGDEDCLEDVIEGVIDHT